MHGHQERLGFKAVSIFSWSYFISEHLLTRYKFIPTHLSIKIYHYIKTIKTQIKLFFIFNYHVRAALDREHGSYISFTLCRGCTLSSQLVSPDLQRLYTFFVEWQGIHYEAFTKTRR